VELHGGTIEAQSGGRGLGSEFIVRLPLAESRAEDGIAAGSQARGRMPSRQPKRILVVDDREDQTRSMRMLLARMGHEVHIANDAPTALQALTESHYDVALIDIGLQGMNGHELARRIRMHPDHKNMLLIAQTGWGRDLDRQRSHEAGFDHHLVKPVDRKLLEEILEKNR
jgi:CheY-like chemotaxis protein